MQLLDVVRRHPLWLGAGFGVVLGTAIGLFLPIRAPEAAPAQEADWSLPTLASTRSYTEANSRVARGAAFWGEQAQPDRRSTAPPWTLRAIATRPIPRIAISSGGRGEIAWVGLRETLPDGSVLVALNRDTAWIERDGCRSPRHLYPTSTDAAADPCAQPASTPPAAAARTASSPPPPQKTETQ